MTNHARALERCGLVALSMAWLAACAPVVQPPPPPPTTRIRAAPPRPDPVYDLLQDVAERIHNEYLTPIALNTLYTRALEGAARTPGLDDASRTALLDYARRVGEARTPQAQATLLESALRGTNLPAASVLEAALTAMVDGLDPHTSYTPPAVFRAMQTSTSGSSGTVGLQVSRVGDEFVVRRPIPGGPAARAGIRTRDVLLSIDDRDLHGSKREDVIPLLQGPVGSTAVLRIRRPGEPTPLSVSIERLTVTDQPVLSRLLGPVAYIALDVFNVRMLPDLTASLASMRTASPRITGILLDLRGSEGGLLDTVVRVTDLFLSKGSSVVTLKSRHEEENQSFRASQDGPAADLPLVVLVDGQTASGAEIVAGALQDNRRALIVGAPTMGIGTVQTIMPLPRGHGAVRLTTSQVLLPSGRPLGATGITPDIPVTNARPSACTPTPCDLPARLRAIRADPALLGEGPDTLAVEVAKAMQP